MIMFEMMISRRSRYEPTLIHTAVCSLAAWACLDKRTISVWDPIFFSKEKDKGKYRPHRSDSVNTEETQRFGRGRNADGMRTVVADSAPGAAPHSDGRDNAPNDARGRVLSRHYHLSYLV
jgi:hypothetical protein